MSNQLDYIKQFFPELEGSAVLIAFLAVYFGVLLFIYLLYCIACWKMFTKMGEKGWKVLIPVYNIYILAKCVSGKKYFACIVAFIFANIILSTLSAVFSYNNLAESYIKILDICHYIIMISLLVVEILLMHKLSKAFGHGAGFTVGLVLLPLIFVLILGFGDSKYIGTGDAEKANQ